MDYITATWKEVRTAVPTVTRMLGNQSDSRIRQVVVLRISTVGFDELRNTKKASIVLVVSPLVSLTTDQRLVSGIDLFTLRVKATLFQCNGMQDLNKVYKTGVVVSSSLCSLFQERACSLWP
ncbi:hypothetical protein EMCRGX_G005127 [Ephydatia muelleri]